ncbi:dihydrofolate reductase [Motiliproteus sediminis]|uniref:dihydrofolate reductase n=1 Tax=Motiliproteus sediminis TaxID=1468178 RepID=UPI001AEF6D63|nr:dihydrofolate reductase [Motiliproteus sediminis]
MRLAAIVAQAQNRVIGNRNRLPWHLPEDLKYFKSVTLGKPIIMGRKTFESIGRPLPGRTNIVVTRDPAYQRDGIEVVHSLDQAIERAEQVALINGGDEALVIGGAELYAQALPRIERLYLTQVHDEVEGDAYFPAFDPAEWQQSARQDFSSSGCNPFDYSFIVLERR